MRVCAEPGLPLPATIASRSGKALRVAFDQPFYTTHPVGSQYPSHLRKHSRQGPPSSGAHVIERTLCFRSETKLCQIAFGWWLAARRRFPRKESADA